jgi:hypothetical protein
MVITKALALWLFIVGVVWAFVIAWVDLVMTGFTERIISLPVFLLAIRKPSIDFPCSTLCSETIETRSPY